MFASRTTKFINVTVAVETGWDNLNGGAALDNPGRCKAAEIGARKRQLPGVQDIRVEDRETRVVHGLSASKEDQRNTRCGDLVGR